jgi:DCN1-like protein 1/2
MELNFDRFCSFEKASQMDSITGRGLAQFFSEIAVPPSSLDYFVVLWKLGATVKGCITRAEWVMAMYTHGIESLTQLKLKLVEWVKEVRNSGGSFLLMYNFLYDYIRGEDDRRMSLANATKAWDVLFEKKDGYQKWKLWAAECVPSNVSRDLWQQVGVLFVLSADQKQVGGEASLPAALPTVISDFLEQKTKAT